MAEPGKDKGAAAPEAAPLAMPERHKAHWLFAGLYSLCTGAAFWQHGHAYMTLCVMAGVFLCALAVYAPMRVFDDTMRWLAQTLVVLFAGLWAVFRFKEHQVELDVVFTEFLCLAGLSFFIFEGNSRYKFINGICLVLLFYGAVFPRAVYVYLFPIALFAGLLVLYMTRPAALSGSFEIAMPRWTFRRNWSFMLLHAGIALSFFVAIYAMFPFDGVRGPGLLFVSFKNANESYAPEEVGKWMNAKPRLPKDSSKILVSGADANSSSKDSTAVSERLPSLGESLVNGSGSSQSGDKLLFRVFSPLKLYWLCRLYDSYDGLKWTASKPLESGRSKFSDYIWRKSESLEQKIKIEDWFSRSLPCAFLPVSLAPDINRRLVFESSSYGFRMPQGALAPAAPFTYSVISRVPLMGQQQATGAVPLLEGSQAAEKDASAKAEWNEPVPRKNCLALPGKLLSARLKALPLEICGSASTPYSKAIAIRDWLRSSFKYEQFSSPPPEGAESVDFFIFELKKGHCEYFASAMTVLARLSGIPARVATGFSPGNYDALNKCFDVYEYHAHAWAQLYFEGSGWLTFDATPQGQIVSRTTPYGFGSLQDPFGDEWRVMPPELSKETQRYLTLKRAESLQDPVERMASAPGAETLLGALMKIPLSREEIDDSLRELKTRKDAKAASEKKGGLSLLDAVQLNMKVAFESSLAALRRGANWLFSINGLVLALIAACVFSVRALFGYLRSKALKARRLAAAMARLEEATAKAGADPQASIAQSYRMVREMLEMAGCPRVNNMDLFDYGKSLEARNGALSSETLVLFFIYSRSVYGMLECSREDSAEALRRAVAIREMLLPMIARA